MESKHRTVREENGAQVTVRVYADGDVVVCHENEGGCVNVADTSGYDPLLELCDGLGLDGDVEDDVLDFVQDNTDLFE